VISKHSLDYDEKAADGDADIHHENAYIICTLRCDGSNFLPFDSDMSHFRRGEGRRGRTALDSAPNHDRLPPPIGLSVDGIVTNLSS
jgi:hypothetical protein